MGIANSTTVRFTPRGLTDAADATDVFPGACTVMQNLIFDQSNPELLVARPGVGSPVTVFASFITPGFISVVQVIGNRAYGMIATGLTPGHDEPFAYDLVQNVFYPISGVTAGNAEGRPISPSPTGDWTPPTMAVVGPKLIITHPGYSGGAAAFGVLDLTNANVPVYSTANTTPNALPGVPAAVANFNNRAYFAIGNQAFFSDSLDPLKMTNAGQAVTIGDVTPIVALGGLPLSTLSGGVVSALLAFKGSQIWQIVGDEALATAPLATSYITLTLGTRSPRSLALTQMGVFFIGPDGVYLVSLAGVVTPLASPQKGTSDIVAPFANIVAPSRAAGAYSANIYRVELNTVVRGASVENDYWFDLRRGRWTGPHTFAYDCAAQYGNAFVLASGGMLFVEKSFVDSSAVYNDNGAAYQAVMQSSTFPKRGDMRMYQMVESTLELSGINSALGYAIIATNERGSEVGNVSVPLLNVGIVWNGGLWGDGSLWNAPGINLATNYLNWADIMVINKLAISVQATANVGLAIGTFYGRVQPTGYTLYEIGS